MIIITRRDTASKGQVGDTNLGGKLWFTMEQSDNNNEPFKSCIPLGDYDLVPYTSKKYGKCFVAVNPDLNVYKAKNSKGRPENGRYACLFFHKGNYPKNFQGCSGAGDSYVVGSDMITNTASACRKLNRLVTTEGSLKLRIQYEWE